MSDRALQVLVAGRLTGVLTQTRGGQHEFQYTDGARTPVSTSMTISPEVYRQRVVEPWLLGLLPDRQAVRAQWGAEFGVSGENPFALLEHMGLDCPGAVQFVPERVDPDTLASTYHLVDDAEIGRRLADLRIDEDTWTVQDEHWSLAGAQSKFALANISGRWAEAKGSAATTHIIKPGVSSFRLQALNEHVCMVVARMVGLRAASTSYREFAGQPALVVRRYDRTVEADAVRRVQQEDFCQAMSVYPSRKYEADGGPSAVKCVDLVRRQVGRRHGEADVDQFVGALVYNFLISGSDAHAKNYSLLLAGDQVRLAPFYDIASGFPYDNGRSDGGLKRLAMGIDGEKDIEKINGGHWDTFCSQVRYPPDRLRTRMMTMAATLPDAFADTIDALSQPESVRLDLRSRLLDRVAAHCQRVTERLTRWSTLAEARH